MGTPAPSQGERSAGRSAAGDGPLFRVRRRRWQYMVARVVAVAGFLVAALLLLATAGRDDTETGFLIAVVVFLVVCALVVVLTIGLARSAVEAFPDHLRVRSGFGQWRTVSASDIATIETEASRWSGFNARDARRRKLFAVFSVYAGFRELCTWLEQHAPGPWRAYVAPGGPTKR
ncbi:hypothetical protein [Curtobacterium sp. CFBP9011]|uniref:hypothetical protein n=1 Tax=Curtobacterium sp. CFBP9011 TaxID=3096530 RepID=UPI002A69B14A|nr:hypothetical protein [Curtobacterium sp. CFBP9011]MDY1006556.1 hypothetical protein [Curtobacterium sp. CFBP9011]